MQASAPKGRVTMLAFSSQLKSRPLHSDIAEVGLRRPQPKNAASRAKHSSMISSGTDSIFWPLRARRSSVLSWCSRMTPVVCVPTVAREIVKPEARAATPPPVIGQTSTVPDALLKSLPDTIKTGHRPLCSRPATGDRSTLQISPRLKG